MSAQAIKQMGLSPPRFIPSHPDKKHKDEGTTSHPAFLRSWQNVYQYIIMVTITQSSHLTRENAL